MSGANRLTSGAAPDIRPEYQSAAMTPDATLALCWLSLAVVVAIASLLPIST